MFAYIKGSLEEKATNYVVIEVSGIGYKIFMSNISINEIGELGTKVKVHTHYYVREDNISLYGFLTHEELKMFELLLSVSGIGAKSAISMLSTLTKSWAKIPLWSILIWSILKRTKLMRRRPIMPVHWQTMMPQPVPIPSTPMTGTVKWTAPITTARRPM